MKDAHGHAPGYPADLLAQSILQHKLDSAFARIARKRVVVACSVRGVRAHAAVGATDPRTAAAEWAVPTGCITKLLVGALATDAASGRLAPEAAVAPLLGATPASGVVADTTIRHLLEHTHGLDDSLLECVPRNNEGRIDVDALLERLAPHRFAPPGALYSYSNAGAWLLAALLERIDSRPFAAQLREDLLAPLGLIEKRSTEPLTPHCREGLCPALGATLAMTADDLLTFLEARIARDRRGGPLAAGRAGHRPTPLPGWNPLERGVHLGWKVHGDGWLGHHSTWPGASLMVRVRPRDEIALVLASRDHAAPVIAANLFADVLPEYRNLDMPQPLPPARAASLDLRRYLARFRSAAETLELDVTRDMHGTKTLALRTDTLTTTLIPAANDVFYLRPPRPQQRPFVQCLGATETGFRYLWDGRCVLRR